VSLMRHRITQKRLLVKKMPISQLDQCNAFMKEVETLQRLKHCSKVISLKHYSWSNRSGWMIFPLMQQDLLELILNDKKQHLSEQQAKELFHQMCIGVQQCHENNIAHLDLKPENFLVSDNRVVLADFGSSVDVRVSARVKGQYGTFLYQSPEQFKDSWFDPLLSDLWSLGMTLYAMLTGTWPFSEKEASNAKWRVEWSHST